MGNNLATLCMHIHVCCNNTWNHSISDHSLYVSMHVCNWNWLCTGGGLTLTSNLSTCITLICFPRWLSGTWWCTAKGSAHLYVCKVVVHRWRWEMYHIGNVWSHTCLCVYVIILYSTTNTSCICEVYNYVLFFSVQVTSLCE